MPSSSPGSATQAVLFVGVFVVVLLFLGFNVWLAGRLAPPPDPERVGRVGEFAARIGEAFGVEDAVRPGAHRRAFEVRGAGYGGGGIRTVTFEAEDLPDLVPIARWGLIALAVIIALATAAAAAGQWETVLLWRNQVPFAPAGAAPVVDPDLRARHQLLPVRAAVPARSSSRCSTACSSRPLVAQRRPLPARPASRGGLVFTTPIRVHLAVLGGLYLLSVAVGYQLDKLELVYSTRASRPASATPTRTPGSWPSTS